jgi:hypothetical protein
MKSLLGRTAACLGLGLALLLMPAAGRADESLTRAIPYLKLLEKYGAYEPIVDLLLEHALAVEKKETVVKIALGVPEASARLEVFKFSGTIDLEGGDTCWLGSNRVKLRVPVDYRYEIDLGQLKPRDVNYDPSRNVLEVKLPPVTMAKVVPDYASLEVVEKVNPTFRSRASWYELKEWVLSEQVKSHAEELGEQKLSEANLVARSVVHGLFTKLYAPTKQLKGIAIVVK